MMLRKDRAALLTATTIAEVTLPIGNTFVRVINLREAKAIRARIASLDKDDDANLEAIATVACSTLCDSEGVRMFTDDEIDQVKSISLDYLMAIFEVAVGVNGLKPGKALPPTNGSS